MTDEQIFRCWEEFKQLLKSTNREGVDNVIKWLDETDFKFAPASTQFHNSFRGGLLKHSLDVYYSMYDFKTLIDFFNLSEDTIILTSLLHDVCKIECYETEMRNKKTPEGEWIQVLYYTFNEVRPWGHAPKSVIELQKRGLKLTDVEISMILNHMGYTSNEDTRVITKCFAKCPQSLVLHYADMNATFILESEDIPQRYKQKLEGNNLANSNSIYSQKQMIEVDGFKYRLAPQDSVVDNQEIIEVNIKDTQGLPQKVKVYSPHKDGLPF